jgi:hypothetical protein
MQGGGRAEGARDGDAGGGATEDAGRHRQRGGRSNQCCRSGSGRIRIILSNLDPHPHPDPHESYKPNPEPDQHQFADVKPKCMEILALFQGFEPLFGIGS